MNIYLYPILSKINTPKDLKRLSPTKLVVLAGEIRDFLIHSISDTGGHLASNLGVTELTIALHTVLNSPKDKIVWDVGHQSYIHKILTGRKGLFNGLRKLDGLSGFPKITESKHDAFGTGHSSTSISAALGLATSRDLKGTKEKVVAVIGDGSMTGGLAYEGLNNAGRANTDLLVVLNDNQMSICKNVGAISRHLNEIRTTSRYLDTKQDVHQILDKLPLLGDPISRGIEATKSVLRRAVTHGVLFEEMGFRYFGPIDGHDIKALIKVLRNVKNIKGPVLLHVITKKGKGYNKAERSPTNFHGIGTFNVNTGKPINIGTAQSYTDVFSRHLCKRALENNKIVAISAAMSDGTGLDLFEKKFKRRFFDVGIAEGHGVTFAAGLAQGGMRPVVAIYSSFLQRAYDQILHDVAIQKLPVIFAVDRAGIVGEDGETHQGLYDFAYLSHIPGMVVLAPSSGNELEKMLDFALAYNGPVAIRYPRAPADIAQVQDVEYAKAEIIEKGKDVAIISVGAMRNTSIQVLETLKEKGLRPSLYNARFVKPIDTNLIQSLKDYKYVFTIEDATTIGGFGSLLKAYDNLPKIKTFAFPDTFIVAGTRQELLQRHELDHISLVDKILNTYEKEA